MESKIQKSLIQKNIENILLAVMVINYYVLLCVDGKFNKPFQTYLGEDAV